MGKEKTLVEYFPSDCKEQKKRRNTWEEARRTDNCDFALVALGAIKTSRGPGGRRGLKRDGSIYILMSCFHSGT